MPFVTFVKSFEEDREWVKYQIDSFNNFIDFGLQKIINEVGTLRVVQDSGDLKLKFGEVEIGRPIINEADGSTRAIYPNEARIRNLTYMAPVFVTITPIVSGVQEKAEKVHIGDLPIMVRSKVCMLSGLSEEELVEVGRTRTIRAATS